MVMVGEGAARRYEFTSVKERAVAEFVRRIRDKEWRFNTVAWDKVSRLPLPSNTRNLRAPIICVTDGVETFGTGNGTQTLENSVDLSVEIAVPVGQDEEPATVLNIVSAEVLNMFLGQHELFEGGDGEQLTVTLYPRQYLPDLESFSANRTATAMLIFEMRYRTRRHNVFLLPVPPAASP